jgi:hypothetical protein
MISTYLLYQSYASDLPKTLARIGSQSQVASAGQYYRDNIGKVTTVDQFLDDSRLFSYAMTAYGLTDFGYAKGFMKKVLTSDLSDQNSFVNKLTDPRFATFAKAFQFSTDGTLATQPVVAQDTNEENDTIGLYTQTQVNKGTAAADEATYYQSQIGSITSVDQLINNPALFNYAVKAYGINPDYASKATIKAVLTSDLSDPNSVANTLNNSNYKDLAAAFSFNADGSVNGSAQSPANTSKTVYQYFNAAGAASSPAAAAYKTQYFQATIGSVTSVDDLMSNDALYEVAMTSFGLNPALESPTLIRQVLTSDLSDPNSVANTQANAAYKKLAAAFNFNADGSVNGSAETAAQTTDLVNLYSTAYDDAQESANNDAIAAYKDAIENVTSINDLLKSTAFNFILDAYGFDIDSMSKYTLTKILQSNPADPNSFANQSHNPAYIKLASDFNFDAKGNAKTATVAQTNAALASTVQLYLNNNGGAVASGATPTPQQTLAQTESTYYASTIGTIRTADDLLKDQRLVDYTLSAYGLSKANLTTAALKKILTSDPLDPASYVNQPENAKYRPLAVAFNFDSKGNPVDVPASQVQDRGNLVATTDGYVEQTMEMQAGDQSDGARLALYFLKKASSITSPLQLLADKALLQFTQTALGLPSTMSQADIDTQVDMITDKLNIADLQDPTKLNKLISQFAALYDVTNSTSSDSPIVQILQNTGGSNARIITIDPVIAPLGV